MTIEEFLNARYDEAEADLMPHLASTRAWGKAATQSRRADIAMKRRIVKRAWTAIQYRVAMLGGNPDADAAALDAFWILDELASVYSAHPDFDPSWKPVAK